MLLDQGKEDEVIALAEGRISKYPGDGQAHWWLGKACYHAGDFERALVCMLKVQDLQPDWDLSNTAPFIEAIRKKLAGNSSESGLSDIPFPDRARMLLDQDKAEEAIALAEERISKFPADGLAYWYLGKACYRVGDFQRALASVLRAQELQPDWHVSDTAPFIQTIQEKLAENATKPELKVVTLKPAFEGGVNNDEPINS